MYTGMKGVKTPNEKTSWEAVQVRDRQYLRWVVVIGMRGK